MSIFVEQGPGINFSKPSVEGLWKCSRVWLNVLRASKLADHSGAQTYLVLFDSEFSARVFTSVTRLTPVA